MGSLHRRPTKPIQLQRLIARLLKRWLDKKYWISLLMSFASASGRNLEVDIDMEINPFSPHLFQGSVSGTMLSGAFIDTSAEGELIIQVYRDDVVLYEVGILLAGTFSVADDWRYIDGTRSRSDFEYEMVTALTGNVEAFTFDKLVWGARAGYADDGYNLNNGDPEQLTFKFTVVDFVDNIDGFNRYTFPLITVLESTSRVAGSSYDDATKEHVVATFTRYTIGIFDEDPDAVFGVGILRPIAGGNPLGTVIVPQGNVPAIGASTTGDNALFVTVQNAQFCKVQTKVNGHYPIVAGIKFPTKSLMYLTHNGGTSRNTRENWNIEALTALADTNEPAVYPDDYVEYNGYPIIWYGSNLRAVYYDGALWQDDVIDNTKFVQINQVSFPALGFVVVSSYDGANHEIDMLTYTGAATGADRINPANYSITHSIRQNLAFNSYGMCVAGLDGTYSFPIIWYCDYDNSQVFKLTRNAGVAGTPADWDEVLIADLTIPPVPPQVFGVEPQLYYMEHDAVNGRVLIGSLAVGNLYSIDTTTEVVTTIFGDTTPTHRPAYKV